MYACAAETRGRCRCSAASESNTTTKTVCAGLASSVLVHNVINTFMHILYAYIHNNNDKYSHDKANMINTNKVIKVIKQHINNQSNKTVIIKQHMINTVKTKR